MFIIKQVLIKYPSFFSCDCRPSHLYLPRVEKCFPAYRNYQNICEEGNILVPNKTVPQCVKNDCGLNEVFFNGACEKLDEEEGCSHFAKIVPRKLYLIVNPSSNELACIDESVNIICVNDCCKSKNNSIDICLHRN